MKKTLLALSLFVMSMGMFAQSTIWAPHNPGIDTAMGTRWLSAVDANTAWEIGYSRWYTTAVYNVFARTGDGGNTYTQGMFLPDTLYYNSSNISATNDSVAYIPCYSKDATRNGVIMKTTDKGVTWTNVADTSFMFVGGNNFPDWAHFWDNNHGIVMGDPNGGSFEIYLTNSGGSTWTRVPTASITPTPGSTEYGVTDVFTWYGSKHVWFGTNHGGSTTASNHVYCSSDTGHSWKGYVITGINAGVSGLAFRDSLNGLAWGYNSTSSTAPFVLKRTNDGGATWATIPQHNNVGIFDITAVPGRNAFLSVGLDSSHAAYITSVTYDDGANWTVLESGIQEAQRMIQVTMLDSAHGWAGCFSDTTQPLGANGMDTWMGPNLSLGCPVYITGTASVCSGTAVTLAAHGAGSYTWTPGSVTTSTVSVSPSSTTMYTVTAVGGSGCTNTATFNLTVKPTPTVSTTFAPNDTICALNSTQIMAAGGTTYNWAPATGLSSTTSATVTASPSSTTTYTLTGSTNGCNGTTMATVVILPCTGINEVGNNIASIFPNPSHGNITIDFGHANNNTKVVISDMIGNQVYQTKVAEGTGKLNVDLTSMPKGLYLVTVSNGTGSFVQKMIVE